MARIGLTLLPRRTQKHVFDVYGINVDAGPYRKYFDAAVSNEFPAEFAKGRWTVDEADLDRVAVAMGKVPAPRVNEIAGSSRTAVSERASA